MTRRRRIPNRGPRPVAGPRRRTPVAFGRSLSRRKAGALLFALLVLAVLIALDRNVEGVAAGDDWRRYHGQRYAVARVIDGDTIDLAVTDGEKATTRVRLWGVDTPEKAGPGGARPAEPYADEATALTRELVEGQTVTLYLEPHRLRGSYGRLLAFVELPDGTSLNQRLIEAGYSPADNRWSHSRRDAFAEAERRARQAELGLWSKTR